MLLSEPLTKAWNSPSLAAFTVQTKFVVAFPDVSCFEPPPVTVQCERTTVKAPRVIGDPPTCQLCASECLYPVPVTVIVQEAEPEKPFTEASVRPAAGAVNTAPRTSAAARSRERDIAGVSHSALSLGKGVSGYEHLTGAALAETQLEARKTGETTKPNEPTFVRQKNNYGWGVQPLDVFVVVASV
jgi:hypothetical protein